MMAYLEVDDDDVDLRLTMNKCCTEFFHATIYYLQRHFLDYTGGRIEMLISRCLIASLLRGYPFGQRPL
jgi:hypothetical protein